MAFSACVNPPPPAPQKPGGQTEPASPECRFLHGPQLDLQLKINSEGFVLGLGGRAGDWLPSLPKKAGAYDYLALQEKLREVVAQFPVQHVIRFEVANGVSDSDVSQTVEACAALGIERMFEPPPSDVRHMP